MPLTYKFLEPVFDRIFYKFCKYIRINGEESKKEEFFKWVEDLYQQVIDEIKEEIENKQKLLFKENPYNIKSMYKENDKYYAELTDKTRKEISFNNFELGISTICNLFEYQI